MRFAKSLAALSLVCGLGLSGCAPTPTPVAPDPNDPDPIIYNYDLPLTVMAVPECQGANQVIYEVRTDGTFAYYPGDYNPFSGEASAQLQQRTLSGAELRELDDRLEFLDIAREFQTSTAVPPGTPTTMECRTVTEYIMQVNGQTRSFDANGRSYVHSQAYREAVEKLRLYLEDLKGE